MAVYSSRWIFPSFLFFSAFFLLFLFASSQLFTTSQPQSHPIPNGLFIWSINLRSSTEGNKPASDPASKSLASLSVVTEKRSTSQELELPFPHVSTYPVVGERNCFRVELKIGEDAEVHAFPEALPAFSMLESLEEEAEEEIDEVEQMEYMTRANRIARTALFLLVVIYQVLMAWISDKFTRKAIRLKDRKASEKITSSVIWGPESKLETAEFLPKEDQEKEDSDDEAITSCSLLLMLLVTFLAIIIAAAIFTVLLWSSNNYPTLIKMNTRVTLPEGWESVEFPQLPARLRLSIPLQELNRSQSFRFHCRSA